MKRLGVMVHPVVYSNLWIGLGAALQVYFTYCLLDRTLDQGLMLMAGFGTVAVYNWQRLVRVRGRIPEVVTSRHRWIERNRKVLWPLTVVSSVAGCWFFLQLRVELIVITAGLGLIAFFYTLPWFSGSKRKGLREFPHLKLFLVGLCWAGVTSVLPMFSETTSDWNLLLILERFLFITAITIPFDIRDIGHDDSLKKTVPQVLGVKKAKGLAMVIWLASTCVMITILSTSSIGKSAQALIVLGYVISGLLISRSDRKQSELFYTGALDGTLVLIPFLCWLGSN